MKWMADVPTERLAQFPQQITFKKIHEIVAATPVNHLPAPNDETILVIACDKGRPVKTVIGIVVYAIYLPTIKRIPHALWRGVPVFDRSIRRIHGPRAMAMLVALPASAKTSFVAPWHV
jgi:hypothetical protein